MKDHIMLDSINIENLLRIAKEKNYPIFESKRNYQLNIWGIRAIDRTVNIFNDYEVVFWKDHGLTPLHDEPGEANYISGSTWKLFIFKITTEPGTHYLLYPINKKGTAILKEGFYYSCWRLGLHRGKYKALIQCGPMTVYRDNDKDDEYDFDVPTDTGMFGINNHRAGSNYLSRYINQHSAGCQVVWDPVDYDKFIGLIEKAVMSCGNIFSYILINENDLYK